MTRPAARGQSNRGPKSKYHTHVLPRLESIRAWRRNGLTEKEIMVNLGVGHSAFAEYKNSFTELAEVLKSGKLDADAQVENALFKRAIGYEYEEVKTLLSRKHPTKSDKSKGADSSDKPSEDARVEKVRKHVVPDVTAQIFYLKNRCSDRWKDRQEHGLTDGAGDPLPPGSVQIVIPHNGRDEAPPTAVPAGKETPPCGTC